MDFEQIIEQRHSVRAYTQKDIEQNLIDEINLDIEKYNNLANLNIQFITNEPYAFGKSILADVGRFKNVDWKKM